jgi:hypothetical protein
MAVFVGGLLMSPPCCVAMDPQGVPAGPFVIASAQHLGRGDTAQPGPPAWLPALGSDLDSEEWGTQGWSNSGVTQFPHLDNQRLFPFLPLSLCLFLSLSLPLSLSLSLSLLPLSAHQ